MVRLDYVEITSPLEGFSPSSYSGPLKPTRTEAGGHPVRWADIEKKADEGFDVSVWRKPDGYELKVGLRGKILGSRYQELINPTNIGHCLEIVQSKGIIDFNVEHVLTAGQSSHLHVTEDILIDITADQRRLVGRLVRQPWRWNYQILKNSFGLMSKEGRIKREQFKIYNKEVEMKTLAENRAFMQRFGIKEDAFDGITRIEHKLQGRKRVLNRLGIDDSRLTTILNVERSPTVKAIGEIFDLNTDEGRKTGLTLAELEKLSFVKQFMADETEIDWQEVKREVRVRDPKNVARKMEQYESIYRRYNEADPQSGEATTILEDIIGELEARW